MMATDHRCLAYQHDAGRYCPVRNGKHIIVKCSCGESWSVEVADDIWESVKRHHPAAVWERYLVA